ncbi:hypothetical protein AYJ54_09325 [Bradyrhizobium centrolobii]|uniref:Uncharacterized protein n=1 Tax=Bradyrhizobium centrolobii TaxID=1505087 RepID=A0A176YS20_9BRAD|nr:hypothetical protein [Bradyrhizobium centrolobii]OAF10484.1 hypothetical protein AYJ54_09325 [Bradyrhizobium centrolobii]
MQQDARKNYIGIVNDRAEEERLADGVAQSQPRVMSYLVGRLSAMLRRPHKGTPGRSLTS